MFTLTFTANGVARQPREYFVSTAGNDNNPGSVKKPFLTPEKARNAIRELKMNGNPADTIVVYFRKGDYVRTKTLDLNPEDSGKPNAPVVWKAYQGERVRFIGGRVISGFKPVSEVNVLNRLENLARKNVVMTNLSSLGINDFGRFSSRGFGRPTIPSHGELIFNNLPMTLARWPNTGEWERIRDFPPR